MGRTNRFLCLPGMMEMVVWRAARATNGSAPASSLLRPNSARASWHEKKSG